MTPDPDEGRQETEIEYETAIEWGTETDEPLKCGLENPEVCESCQ